MDEFIQKDILEELKVIKKLLAHSLLTEESQVKQIIKLKSIGFQPKEIAEIVGTSSNTVSVALSKAKKAK